MSETGIVQARTRPVHAFRDACATCKIGLDVRTLDRYAGFCHECLDRSRIIDDDDLGGEC